MRSFNRLHTMYWPLLASLIALSTYLARHRHGIGLSPDGWAYWQGAVSMLEGNGYKYFSGNPIIAWPPLYSLYIALWTMVLGPYGITLIVSNALLIALQAFGWFQLFLIVTKQSRLGHDLPSLIWITLYIGLFVSVNQTSVLAQTQTYVLLPLFLIAVWSSIHATGNNWPPYIGASCLGAALLLTHNASIVFVGAGVVLIILLGRNDIRGRLAGGALVLLVSVLLGKIARDHFGQTGSHPFVGGQHSALNNFLEIGIGIGQLLGPNSLAMPCFLMLLAVATPVAIQALRSDRPEGFTFSLMFCALSIAMLVFLFSAIWLNGSISEGRHLLFLPLVLVPILLYEAAKARLIIFAILLCLLIPTLMYRSLKWGLLMIPEHYIAPWAELSRVPAPGEVMNINGRVLVGPIAWEEPAGGYSSGGVPQWAPSQMRRTLP